MPTAQITADLLSNNITELDEDDLQEVYDTYLDEVHEQCSYVQATPSELIKDQSPTDYNCGFSDWLDGQSDTYECVEDRYFDKYEFDSFEAPFECDECGDECDETEFDGLCDTCEDERIQDEEEE